MTVNEDLAWIEKYKLGNYVEQDTNLLVDRFWEEFQEHYNWDYGSIWSAEFEGKEGVWISTGGWSDNEEIIWAMQDTIAWLMHWQVSKRGGQYFFNYEVKQ